MYYSYRVSIGDRMPASQADLLQGTLDLLILKSLALEGTAPAWEFHAALRRYNAFEVEAVGCFPHCTGLRKPVGSRLPGPNRRPIEEQSSIASQKPAESKGAQKPINREKISVAMASALAGDVETDHDLLSICASSGKTYFDSDESTTNSKRSSARTSNCRPQKRSVPENLPGRGP